MPVEREMQQYEAYKREHIGPLEKLGDALSGMDERIDYTNALLARILVALGAPPELVVEPKVTVQPVPVMFTRLGTPLSRAGQVTTTQTTYQTVVEWEVPAAHSGELFEVSMASSGYAHTRFRLVLANVEQWTEQEFQSSLTQPFSGNKLTETQKVQIQAKSTDGTEVKVFGAIAGKVIAGQGAS